MPKLSVEDSARLIGHLEAGQSITKVCQLFNVNKTTVYRLQKKYEQTRSVKRSRGSGRPRKTTHEEDRDIVTIHENDRFKNPKATASDANLSVWTVRRRLKEQGLSPRKPACNPRLTVNHREARLQWAVIHRRWNLDQWSKVLFTDEASFSVSSKDGRDFCYRRQNERYLDCTISESRNRGYGCVSIWGGIIDGRRLPLIRINGRLNADVYIEDILSQHVVPFVRREEEQGDNVILQQDNAPPHRAAITQRYLEDNQISVLPWPAVSPDMNCIENLWALLSRALRNARPQPANADELFNILNQEWDNITIVTLQNYTRSMRRRVNELFKAEGGQTSIESVLVEIKFI